MRKLLCPQCGIANLYIKNSKGERLAVFVMSDNSVVSKDESTLEEFDTETLFCFGCSWSGTSRKLKK